MLKWLALGAVLVSCGGASDEDGTLANTSQCERLREHIVDLRIGSATNLRKDLEQHRAALTNALGPQFVEDCTKRMSAAQVTCALEARDAQAATECTVPAITN